MRRKKIHSSPGGDKKPFHFFYYIFVFPSFSRYFYFVFWILEHQKGISPASLPATNE